MKIYIVTNFGGGENYTPSVFTDKDMAETYMWDLVYSNIKAMYSIALEDVLYDEAHNPVTDDVERERELIRSADLADVYIYKDKAFIGTDDEENIIQLFETEV